ncbi:hypothetical protein M8J76_006349 [Diaphorina citri]|nr:hypothetical protein M8J76_006349 [Diaphorina citri]KAI5743307.1 hypothetical protein M8J77_016703 [Diaphorina citri]
MLGTPSFQLSRGSHSSRTNIFIDPVNAATFLGLEEEQIAVNNNNILKTRYDELMNQSCTLYITQQCTESIADSVIEFSLPL